MTILIAYDGSDGADAAVDEAARLFPGGRAVVVNVWSSVHGTSGAARVALPDEVIETAVERLDDERRRAATDTAQRGAERAHAAGLHAEVLAEPADPSVWATLVRVAEARDVAAVVVGSRGRSGLRAAMLGSVSNAVVQGSRRPVMVVHSRD